ncbi:Fic family protein [Rhodococcus erythropolis]|uniref:type II toxin-antitoxin system death-on-curing family toxin n=1 Tax=Rhodococcus erythropolis TaxID=1833 RepID=UPI002948CFDA|nr:Fic family protein [Rhodococcus erythropolis]MDV6278684.1 Fic family protein [Rhodococcus erythropolis]
MAIKYLTVQQLIAFNAAQEGGVGVSSLAGVETNAYRPQSGFGGHDVFPDLWSKAAAYLHGIASTQYFTDGNKRTAWMAAVIFLDANGMELPFVADIESETLVQAVAQSIFDTDEEPHRTVEVAAEWFRSKWEHANEFGRSDRVDWAVLGMGFTPYPATDGSVLDADKLGVALISVPAVGDELEVHLALRCHFTLVDVGVEQEFDVKIEHSRTGVATMTSSGFPIEYGTPAPSGHEHHPYALMPVTFTGGIRFEVHRPGLIRFVVTRNGRLLTKLPLNIKLVPEIENLGSSEPLTIPDWN